MRRTVSVFGLTCLCCHTQGALGRDGDDQEYFPLSGGVSDGVKITISAKKVTNPGGILEFLTPDRQVAFRWQLDIDNSRVIRSSDLDNPDIPAEMFGGWGFDAGSPIDFEFTKTTFSWAVSINGIRFPWFDWALRSQGPHPLMTHVSVHSGFEEAEVIQARPTCTEPCHPSECATSAGVSACVGNATCYSMKPADGTYAAECSTSTETGLPLDFHGHCCDGLPKSIGGSEGNVNKWVNVFEDAAFVNRTCETFGGEIKDCAAHAGTKALILSYNAADYTYQTWVPTATTARLRDSNFEYPPSTLYNYAAFALKASTDDGRQFIEIDDGITLWNTATFDVDTHNGLIYKVGDIATAAGLRAGMFINLISYVLTDATQFAERRWFEYSRYADSTIKILNRQNKSVSLLVFDEEVASSTECVDDRVFTDPKGNGCGNYTAFEWCNRHAEPSEEWCTINPPQFGSCLLEGQRDADTGLNAGWECCKCGGGTRAPPPEATAASVLLFK